MSGRVLVEKILSSYLSRIDVFTSIDVVCFLVLQPSEDYACYEFPTELDINC